MPGNDKREQHAAQARQLAESLGEQGVRVIQMEMPDINGAVRGKITGMSKGLSPTGTGVSTLIMSFRGGEEITLSPWSSFENGFPKFSAIPDLDTLVRLPWRPETAAVLERMRRNRKPGAASHPNQSSRPQRPQAAFGSCRHRRERSFSSCSRRWRRRCWWP